jgi:hypothetical protein
MPTIAVLVLRFPPTNCYDITEIVLKVVLNTNNTISIPTITKRSLTPGHKPDDSCHNTHLKG